jgi:hypothetical protein
MRQERPFTVELGIGVQNDQLEEYKTILNNETYEALVAFAIKDNDKARDGFDICRGHDLTNFINNLAIQNVRNKYNQ